MSEKHEQAAAAMAAGDMDEEDGGVAVFEFSASPKAAVVSQLVQNPSHLGPTTEKPQDMERLVGGLGKLDLGPSMTTAVQPAASRKSKKGNNKPAVTVRPPPKMSHARLHSQKKKYLLPVPRPTREYLRNSQTIQPAPTTARVLLVVLDLNGTLIYVSLIGSLLHSQNTC